jgi:hypothetical protein
VFQPQTQTLRVRLTRENAECYLPITTDIESDDGIYVWRLNTTAHNALGSAGEVLAEVIGEDYVFDTTPICAYRYKNCYLLPRLVRALDDACRRGEHRTRRASVLAALRAQVHRACAALSAAYYDDTGRCARCWRGHRAALYECAVCERLGAQSAHDLRVVRDGVFPAHASSALGSHHDGRTVRHGLHSAGRVESVYARQAGALYETSTTLTDEAAGRHWYKPCAADAATVCARAESEHALLLARSSRYVYYRRGTFRATRTRAIRSLRRTMCLWRMGGWCARGISRRLRSAVEIEIDGEVYYDIDPTMSGSAAVVSYTSRSLHAARILAERNRAEMHALGFADGGIGGADRFHITAGGHLRLACCDAGTLRVGRADYSVKHPCGFAREHADDAFCADSRRVGVGVLYGGWAWRDIPWLNSYGLYDASNPTRSYVGSNTTASRSRRGHLQHLDDGSCACAAAGVPSADGVFVGRVLERGGVPAADGVFAPADAAWVVRPCGSAAAVQCGRQRAER